MRMRVGRHPIDAERNYREQRAQHTHTTRSIQLMLLYGNSDAEHFVHLLILAECHLYNATQYRHSRLLGVIRRRIGSVNVHILYVCTICKLEPNDVAVYPDSV